MVSNIFSKLFTKQRSPEKTAEDSKEIVTAPLNPAVPDPAPVSETAVQEAQAAETEMEAQAPAPDADIMRQFFAAGAQSVGRAREHNEDSLYMLTTLAANNDEYTPLGLYIVADGMGGHEHGEMASGLAVHSIANAILRKIIIVLTAIHPTAPSAPLQEILEDSVMEAHKIIGREAPGGGTTLTLALLVNRTMLIAHIGDSRAYWIPTTGEAQVLTRDHSLVMRMIELGQITEAEAAIHPQRNVLYKALGQGESAAPEISTLALSENNGLLLLCSDGLWGVVPHAELLDIVRNTPDINAAVQKLVDRANELGGPDNITAVLVHVPPTP